MIESMRTSVVALLHKKKSREDMRNYRPISLTCVDYKILSKTMANRMGSTLHLVISEDQNGFVPSRFIGDNNMLVATIIEQMKKHTESGIIAFLDFEKALDRVNHDSMHDVLKKKGIRPQISSSNYNTVQRSHSQSKNK